MTPVNPDSPAEIRQTLEKLGLALKKRWGQNFLINPSARERLLRLLDPHGGESIWEIGPGLGAMTGSLLESGAHVTAFEIDRGLCRYLEAAFGKQNGFTLEPGDFVRTWKAAAARALPRRVLGNLPYRSASLMIASLAEGGLCPEVMIFTVQKEFAERMVARPGTKSYSSFSVLSQACYEVTDRGELKAGSFYPAPEVISSVVELRPRASLPVEMDRPLLSEIARSLFASRRKTLRNNLLSSRVGREFGADVALGILAQEGINPMSRAEELDPDAFVRLAARVAGIRGSSSPAERR